MPIIHKKQLVSTNTYAQQLLDKGKIKNECVIVTDEQTAGKGTASNSWESERGKNLTFSIVLFPAYVKVSEQFLISMAVSLGIKKFLEKNISTQVKIKWPNDIYVGDKKICGMLIENSIAGEDIFNSVIGIGLNINQKKFLSDAPNPISLAQLSGEVYNLENLLPVLVKNIGSQLDLLKKNRKKLLQKDYISNLYRYNEVHKFKASAEVFSGKIIGIDNFGHLFIEKETGSVEKFMFKEVEFII